ncbi:MAG: hypothetical protein ACE5Q6_16995 [Dehalococcoidia bacterium]
MSEDPGRSVLLLEAGPDFPEVDHLTEDLKWGGNFLRSALGPHNWGYTATATPQQPGPDGCAPWQGHRRPPRCSYALPWRKGLGTHPR